MAEEFQKFVNLRQVETGPVEEPFNNGVTAAPMQPCLCGACDACFSFDTTTYTQSISQLAEWPFVSALDGPPPEQDPFTQFPRSSAPSLSLQLPYRSQGPSQEPYTACQYPDNQYLSRQAPRNVDSFFGDTYTPGFMGPIQSQQEQEQTYVHSLGQITDHINNFALQTPATTAPSIADPWVHNESIMVTDFVNGEHHGVSLQCETDAFSWAKQFAENVNVYGYRVLKPRIGSSVDSELKALQKSMSFALQGTRVPPALEQLESLQYTARQAHSQGHQALVVDPPRELSSILERYAVHNGTQFQLCIVLRTLRAYQLEVHRRTANPEAPILWLFHDRSGEDLGAPGWAAIVPSDYEYTISPSYAAALVNPVPAPPLPIIAPTVPRCQPTPRAARSNTVNSNLLHPSSAQQASNRHQNRKGSRRQVKANLSTAHNNKPRPADGKPHQCNKCDKSFLYPKDLRRHETTHSGCKKYACPYCTKAFTRNDNRRRHIRDDHADLTPPPSTATSQ